MNWINLHKEYKGQWVALADDEETVVGSGKSAKEALTAANAAGTEDPILARVPEEDIAYVG